MTKLPCDLVAVPNDWDRRGLPAWTYHGVLSGQLGLRRGGKRPNLH